MGVFHQDEFVTILFDPSPRRLEGLIAKAEYGCLRGIIDENGTLFVWDADSMVHSDLAFDYGIGGTRLDIGPETVHVVLAGGAYELMVPPDNLQEFFETHHREGSSIDDIEVLNDICDAALRRVRSHPSLEDRNPNSFAADIDQRTDAGRKNLELVKELNAAYESRRVDR